MSELAQLLANGLVTGSIIALGAIGLSLVYGVLGLINFAHGEYLTVGAFAAFAANITLDVHMVVASGIAAVVTAVYGVVVELALWAPLRRRGAGVLSLFITSIGLALVMRHSLFLVWGARPRRYAVDVFGAYQLGPVRLSLTQLVVVGAALVVLPAVGALLATTRLGKAMRALSDTRDLAAVTGIDVDRLSLHAWVLAAGLAGLAGVLQGLLQASFTPNTGFTLLLPIFAAVILGGIGSVFGALAGGLALGLAMEVSTWSALAGGVPGVYKPVVAFAALILILLVRPTGVLGRARVPT